MYVCFQVNVKESESLTTYVKFDTRAYWQMITKINTLRLEREEVLYLCCLCSFIDVDGGRLDWEKF